MQVLQTNCMAELDSYASHEEKKTDVVLALQRNHGPFEREGVCKRGKMNLGWPKLIRL